MSKRRSKRRNPSSVWTNKGVKAVLNGFSLRCFVRGSSYTHPTSPPPHCLLHTCLSNWQLNWADGGVFQTVSLPALFSSQSPRRRRTVQVRLQEYIGHGCWMDSNAWHVKMNERKPQWILNTRRISLVLFSFTKVSSLSTDKRKLVQLVFLIILLGATSEEKYLRVIRLWLLCSHVIREEKQEKQIKKK